MDRRTLVCLLVLLLAGCSGPQSGIRSAWDDSAPRPRRIGILPLGGSDSVSSKLISAAIGEALSQSIGAPVVTLSSEGERAAQLRRGLERGVIPTRAILSASKNSGVDAVLIGRITRYRPFPPQAIGLEVALVSAVTGQVIWNALGVVDASDPATLRAARGGTLSVLGRAAPVGALESLDDPQETFLTLQSPESFARFVAEAFVSRR